MKTGKLKPAQQILPDKPKILSAFSRVRSRLKKTSAAGFSVLFIAIAGFITSGCRGSQSALDSAGVQAGRLESLWWLFFSITAAVYVIVMAVMLAALVRRRKGDA